MGFVSCEDAGGVACGWEGVAVLEELSYESYKRDMSGPRDYMTRERTVLLMESARMSPSAMEIPRIVPYSHTIRWM